MTASLFDADASERSAGEGRLLDGPVLTDALGFAALARHNTAHVFNAWTRMPTLAEQVAMSEAFTADFSVVRALLRKGRGHEQAVKLFRAVPRDAGAGRIDPCGVGRNRAAVDAREAEGLRLRKQPAGRERTEYDRSGRRVAEPIRVAR